jgi:hypothetical protein
MSGTDTSYTFSDLLEMSIFLRPIDNYNEKHKYESYVATLFRSGNSKPLKDVCTKLNDSILIDKDNLLTRYYTIKHDYNIGREETGFRIWIFTVTERDFGHNVSYWFENNNDGKITEELDYYWNNPYNILHTVKGQNKYDMMTVSDDEYIATELFLNKELKK